MREELGRIQRGVLDAIGAAILAAGGRDAEISTADVVRAVYGDGEVTKARRVSVLRVTRELPNGVLPGSGGWYIVRRRNHRGWILVAPEPQPQAGEPPPQIPRRPAHDGQLAAAIRLLGSDIDGERMAALGAVDRLLAVRGYSWADVAMVMEERL
jgi:hypothetical protein